MRAIAAACTVSCIGTANAKRAEAAKAQIAAQRMGEIGQLVRMIPRQIDGTPGLPPPPSFGLPYHLRQHQRPWSRSIRFAFYVGTHGNAPD